MAGSIKIARLDGTRGTAQPACFRPRLHHPYSRALIGAGSLGMQPFHLSTFQAFNMKLRHMLCDPRLHVPSNLMTGRPIFHARLLFRFSMSAREKPTTNWLQNASTSKLRPRAANECAICYG